TTRWETWSAGSSSKHCAARMACRRGRRSCSASPSRASGTESRSTSSSRADQYRRNGDVMTKRLFDSRGSMMIGALMMVFVVTLLGVALFDLAVVENRLILGSDCDVRAFYAAEAGLQVAYKNWPAWF